jgi:hypothetical protein
MKRFKSYIYHGLVVLDVAEHLEPPKFPLAALSRVDRRDFQATVDRRRLFVDELDRSLSSGSAPSQVLEFLP